MGIAHILIASLFLSTFATRLAGYDSNGSDPYVRDACSVTAYRSLCIQSLSPFSRAAKTSPSKWARAGVSVTIGEVKNVSQFLNTLTAHNVMRGRNRVALSDCTECFQDAIDNLHRSLNILRNLDAASFDTQMADLTTWLSAALTDGDTCLDGFESSGDQIRKLVRMLQNRVMRAGYFTSNALALVNKLAGTGIEKSLKIHKSYRLD